MFIQLKRRVIPLVQVQECHVDYEASLVFALREAFPMIKLHGCHFHFSQCLIRRINKLRLMRRYKEGTDFNRLVRMLKALVYVPVPDIVEAFVAVTAMCTWNPDGSHKFPVGTRERAFYDYFEKVWVGRMVNAVRCDPRFPISLWNCYELAKEGKAKTTNSLEAWHRAMRSNLATEDDSRPKFWKWIYGLRKECGIQEAHLINLESGGSMKLKQADKRRSIRELIRQGAASISYVPVQLDGLVEDQSKIPARNTSAYRSRLIDKMMVYSAPILLDHSDSVHPIPVTNNINQRTAQFSNFAEFSIGEKFSTRFAKTPNPVIHAPSIHSPFSALNTSTTSKKNTANQFWMPQLLSLRNWIDYELYKQPPLVKENLKELLCLWNLVLPFSGPSGPPPDRKVLKSAMEKQFLGHWQSVLPRKMAEIPVLPDNYCDLHEYPQTRLDLDQLQRLDAHFIYNKSCSPQFFQCSVGQTFVLNCPGDDQAFDPAISSCNFKNSIRLCPEYDHVMHCSIREQCTPNQFACCALPQQCIDLQRRCDGHRDCADGEDENNCPSCARNEFACVKNGLCIPAKKRCDGRIDDCMDGSNLDEMGCSKNETCWGKFVCDSQATLSATGHSVCLDWAQHCDGHRDCAGGEDELNCKLMEAKYLLCENQSSRSEKSSGVMEKKTVWTDLMKNIVIS
uniref:Chitin-binding type-2 domain-containing protein n=1 Tax=Ditylenchus dipsaci TaxID=166011 RepID=A0A915DMQ4_9BILA